MAEPLNVFIVTGEPSGDALGGPLMSAIRGSYQGDVNFFGVGGDLMLEQGLRSLFPMRDLALMGIDEIIGKLPKIYRRIQKTVHEVIERQADILVIIDSPDFTHQVAKRVRKRAPHIPIINYVSPTVWAWRSGRAKRMRGYIDKVLAIFPFEVQVHKDLSGPPCVYVGHPLVDRIRELRGKTERTATVSANPKLLVMPGSRPSEIRRLMPPFGETLARVSKAVPNLKAVLPVVSSVRNLVEAELATWPISPELVHTETEKFRAFGEADAALVASGTATLELALARVPMVAAYRIDLVSALLRWMVNVPSVLLPNLIAGQNFVPELIHKDCTVDNLVEKTLSTLQNEKTRQQQLDGFEIVTDKLALESGSPSQHAAEEILALAVDSATVNP